MVVRGPTNSYIVVVFSFSPFLGVCCLVFGRVLVSTFGFDERPIVRAISRHGGFDRVYAVALRVDDGSWRRVESAYSVLRGFLGGLGVDVELVPVELGEGGFARLVWRVKGFLRSVVEGSREVWIQLSGGSRVIVLAVYTAALGLEEDVAGRVRFLVEGEGFDAEFVVGLGDLRFRVLGVLERKVLRCLVEAGGAEVGPSEVSRGLGIAKSTAHKYLRLLAEKGLAVRLGNGRYVATPAAYIHA